MRKYTTKQGDTWDVIAKKEFGWEHYWVDIMNANPQYRNIMFFESGVELILPDVKPNKNKELPPWKR